MRNITRKLLSSACAAALAANGLTVGLAQEKKQEKREAETHTFVFQTDGPKTVTVQRVDGQDPTFNVRVPEPGIRSEGQNFSWMSSGGQQGGDGIFQFFSEEMSFDSRLVKNAPFSAETVTESVQTLADGNRIVQRTEGRAYRDSQGRTRTEKTYRMGGSNTERQTITIYDPNSGENYTLDPATRTARKMSVFLRGPQLPTLSPRIAPAPEGSADAPKPKKITVSGGVLQGSALKRVQPAYPPIAKAARASGAVQVQVTIDEVGGVVETAIISGHPLLRDAAEQAARQWLFKPTELAGTPVKVQGVLTFNFTLAGDENAAPSEGPQGGAARGIMMAGASGGMMRINANTEKIGKQTIEGVECEGTRTVMTLPAGAIGNENPIQTVQENWYSPDLKMTIMTKRSDPRFGENTYRVTNLVRAEPDATLFQLPNDYTIKEGGSFNYNFNSNGRGAGVGVGSGQNIEIRKVERPNQP